MEDIKKEIIDWFNGPQDYDKGMELLQRVSKKNKVIGKMIKRGESRASFEKLIWELNKVAGLKKIPVPAAKLESGVVKVVAEEVIKPKEDDKKGNEKKPEEGTMYSLIKGKDIDSYPQEIRRLVKESSSLYMQRGKKHSALMKLGDGNDAETVEKRSVIVSEIAKISDRLEILFNAFKAYEDGKVMPDVKVLWPEAEKTDAKGKTGADDSGITSSVNTEDLKALKKNLQSSIVKDKNLLAFGTKTKPKEGNGSAMPAGPKRTKLEKRIEKKEKQIKEIDQRIADLS